MDTILIENLIVGAGPAGLAMGAVLNSYKKDYLIIEKSDCAGAAWVNHYDRVHLHTVKEFSNLPFFPFPKNYPQYVPKKLLLEYFSNYAKKFSLKINFSSEAKSIRDENGNWEIQTESKKYLAKNLIICTGYNNIPKSPVWKGIKNFKGEIIHSKNYLNGKRFFGKRVLVVGIGNTGGEISLDLFESGAKVDICVRGPVRVVPRDLSGIPMQYSAILFTMIPARLADFLSKTILKFFVKDMSHLGFVTPDFGTVSQLKIQEKVPLIDIGTVALIQQGIIKVQKGIAEIFENEILFEDGSRGVYDVVLLATGYSSGLSNLIEESSDLFDAKGNPAIKGTEAIKKGLYFLGFSNHLGGFLRNIGVEAKSIGKEIMRKSK
jgi:indole-3-pyruvate monooxygenase